MTADPKDGAPDPSPDSATPSARRAAVEARMRPLRRRYLEQMGSRIDALASSLARARENTMAASDRDALIIHAHKLAGSGALYGFADISATARQLEHALMEPTPLSPGEIAELIDPVIQACHAASRSVGASLPQAPLPAEYAPAAQPAENAPSTHAAESQALPPVTAERRPPVLLIVDDDDAIHSLLGSMFMDVAHVRIESTAEGASRSMAEHRPDLVILDDNLTGANTHDGLQLLDLMQQHKVLKDVPVIMLTGQARPPDVLRGLAAGAIDFVAKPFDVNVLGDKVRARLKRLSTTLAIADEDVFLRDLLATRFRALGYRVLVFDDGSALMECLQWRHVDLLITEWMLPRIDAITILQQMHDGKLKQVPVMLMSTRRRGDDMLEAFDAGALDYVTKPIRLDELMARATRLLPQAQERGL